MPRTYASPRVPESRNLNLLLAAASLALATTYACGQLGYSNRVLQRVPSPDGQLVAVCQEIPAFDGPGYDIRVEDLSGRVRAHLYQGLDDDQCDEIVWSADGESLAVLTRFIARVRVVNVTRSLAGSEATKRSGFITEASFSSVTAVNRGRNQRFVAPGAVEITLCSYEWEEYKRTRQFSCTSAERTESIAAPPVG